MSSIACAAEPMVTSTAGPRMLVLCYSRSGTTRIVGQAIATALGADFEELQVVGEPAGLRSYARCGLDIIFRRKVKLAPLAHNPATYAAVVIGTPVWMARMSSPVRTFLKQSAAKLPPAALFLTHGGTARDQVFAEMEKLLGRTPIGRVAVNEREFSRREFAGKVAAFVGEMKRATMVTV